MDEAAIERAGFTPVQPALAAIDALKTRADIVTWLQQAHARAEGRAFGFGVSADYKNAKRQIAFAGQGGLGLPGPEYYSKDEYAKLRAAYVAHIARLFELTGHSPAEEAQSRAALVMALETQLAAASLQRVELRKPENQYNFVTVEQANKVTPHWDWGQYFKVMQVDAGVNARRWLLAVAAQVLRRPRPAAGRGPGGAMAGLLRLPHPRRRLARAVQGFPGGELRVLTARPSTARPSRSCAGSAHSAPSTPAWARRWASST